ncbi:YjcQ family protein [Ethanoligenens harbinense]|uniref:Uncharacterized protein n=1 Tax=Ethanoligenens harbinense (strain DSM 18485 / JCM 12961 / CGMCC 1.5033 / YUAN-3) TaxID=663278 RepID=E6U3U0_ETHHY|nr:YjcQ family protein [Ethanoligenens harbinense]ADU26507.1 hypothetical protein Ethha_0951 [Ethanoligenens harbinense YUAN-3]AVQ95632.1 hypothetical protein CXQ68_04930 [Ethanoligenens harbinense YUAN-3]AYF38296.1 hypothetical protein CXP51_04790 [Ethanoligenens harbinense]AYF41042.1 hypothetical protein CN246_04925 [Ethanoligenens harbinense]QCN91873.1 hypothetical protein DRA42_04945 [Ethanoligenens harbinense]
MNNDISFVAKQIMKWFEFCNSSVGDIMSSSHLLSLSCKTPIWTSQQRKAIPAAIEHLVEQGYITATENDYIRLAQKGYDTLHMMNSSEIIKLLLEKYQSGDASNIDPAEYGVDRIRLLEIVDIMEKGNLIKGASITRAGQGNKIVYGWPEQARITLQGINYLQGRSATMTNQTTYNISDSSLIGSQIGTLNSQLNFNQTSFSDEITQAISGIKAIPELSQENMETIIDLLGQISIAVQSDNKEEQTEAKFTLKGVIKGMGNAGIKVIGVLSGLANLAKFLGFPAP